MTTTTTTHRHGAAAASTSTRKPVVSPAPGFMFVSPNEAQRLTADEERRRRLERLKQVRDQERLLAARRRERFREQSGREWARAVDDMQKGWEDGKTARLVELEVLLMRLAQYIGRAQADAADLNLEKAIEVETLRKALTEMHEAESIRTQIAANAQRREAYTRIEPELLRGAIIRSVRLQESLRAQLLAHRYREKAKTTAPTVEIPAKPHTHINRLIMMKKPSDYDHTSVHRDHVVVRCHQPRIRDVIPARDVRLAAEIERRRCEDQIQSRRAVLQSLDEVAKVRHSHAMHEINMAKKRETVLKQLGQLDLDDRRRKQINAGLYASNFRRDHVHVGPDELKQRFMRQFDLAEGGEDAFSAPVQRNHPHRPIMRSRPSSISIELATSPQTTGFEPIRAHPQLRPRMFLGDDNASQTDRDVPVSDASGDVSIVSRDPADREPLT